MQVRRFGGPFVLVHEPLGAAAASVRLQYTTSVFSLMRQTQLSYYAELLYRLGDDRPFMWWGLPLLLPSTSGTVEAAISSRDHGDRKGSRGINRRDGEYPWRRLRARMDYEGGDI
jgi:hypothetical protein